MVGSLGEALVAIVISFAVIAVLVPLALCYLLARQVTPVRPGRTMLIVLGCTLVGGPIGLLVGVALAGWLQRRWRTPLTSQRVVATGAGLGRPWSWLVADAADARHRFRQAVDDLGHGPLRDGLRDIRDDVDRAVAEVQRLAEHGSRTQRAQRDVLRALAAQRRRRRRSGTDAVDATLEQSTRAQHASAERLGAAARRDLEQLQLVVGGLHELTAHTLELSTIGIGRAGARGAMSDAAAATADRVAAVRAATAEVEQLAPGARL